MAAAVWLPLPAAGIPEMRWGALTGSCPAASVVMFHAGMTSCSTCTLAAAVCSPSHRLQQQLLGETASITEMLNGLITHGHGFAGEHGMPCSRGDAGLLQDFIQVLLLFLPVSQHLFLLLTEIIILLQQNLCFLRYLCLISAQDLLVHGKDLSVRCVSFSPSIL